MMRLFPPAAMVNLAHRVSEGVSVVWSKLTTPDVQY
jgi:hypothetical protein